MWPSSGSDKVVTARGNVVGLWPDRLSRNAGTAEGCRDLLSLDDRDQDRQSEVRMPGIDRLIQPVRKFALARERAVPFARIISNAADMPQRQLQLDQRQRCIGPGGGIK